MNPLDVPFPFGLPFPTAFYLVLYLCTLMVHIVFMNYVLAGSAYLAAAAVRGVTDEHNPIYELLRDWMPFMLSGAITAGIAPLLFLQVLYVEQFYTANLLLFMRWMAILPALIVGFYLGYLLKTKFVRKWPLVSRALVGCGAFACFAFVGWSWVENHLLSLQSSDVWSEQYRSGAVIFHSPELLPRLTLWFVAAFPTMALVIGWQLWYRDRVEAATSPKASGSDDNVAPIPGSRRTCAIALIGLIMTTLAAGTYFFLLPQAARSAIVGAAGRPYLSLSILGGLLQLAAWVPQYVRARLTKFWLSVATAGLAVNFVGMAVVNECTRLATLNVEALFARHRDLWQVGGMPVFLAFLAINATLVFLCVRIVRGKSRST